MRIQHNIAALNSYRNLTGNNNAVAKNLEKLSSGYRINRAGDDAAGLAISEEDACTDHRSEHSTEERTGWCISCTDSRGRFDRSSLHAEPYGRTC